MARQEHHTSAFWEKEAGFCEAVKIGQNIWVSGTTSSSPQARGSMYDQAIDIFR
jgi:hypothetical protein